MLHQILSDKLQQAGHQSSKNPWTSLFVECVNGLVEEKMYGSARLVPGDPPQMCYSVGGFTINVTVNKEVMELTHFLRIEALTMEALRDFYAVLDGMKKAGR